MNKIKLTFKATECNGWPKLQFLIDQDLIEDYAFTSDTAEITIPVDLVEGTHSLFVELYGKTANNTKIDADGNIIQDQTVELINMYVDDILLPDFYKWLGTYKFNNQIHLQALKWGCNGVWTWDMQIPLVSWLLDKKIENEEEFNPPSITWDERLKLEQEKIQWFEHQLDKL